jgi:hypothetical protein
VSAEQESVGIYLQFAIPLCRQATQIPSPKVPAERALGVHTLIWSGPTTYQLLWGPSRSYSESWFQQAVGSWHPCSGSAGIWLHQQQEQADSNQPQAEVCDLEAILACSDCLWWETKHHLREEWGRAVEASD